MKKCFIDADGCPVTKVAVKCCKKSNIPCFIVCDDSHIFNDDYANVITVGKGSDSTDLKIANSIEKGDIAVTQDYGLAALCIAKKAFAIDQNGMLFSDENMDSLLFSRHISLRARKAGSRVKGPQKRTKDADKFFETEFLKLLKAEY